ncbi:MAG: ZIP family metal transporter [Candidatus ainarchaeum sp.]|nr:ZIP family metal transporter [Candidatus ainarchaeum sp.]
MDSVLLWIIAATALDGLLALVGVLTLWMKPETFSKSLMFMVAFSAGTLLGGALFHLLGEAAATMDLDTATVLLVVGFCSFFVLERVFKWHHCHEGRCDVHPFTYLILLGDGVHNVIDGLLIAASFMVGIPFGIVTCVVVFSHEIPQELGNFAVLVYGGFDRKKALLYNLLAQLTCVIGGVGGYFAAQAFAGISGVLLAFAAGGFIYIAASDLIPELHKEESTAKAFSSFGAFAMGVVFMYAVKAFFNV